MADGGVACSREGEEERGFYRSGELDRRFEGHLGVRGHDMGEESVDDERRTPANSGARVRACRVALA
jgi:hypothetical protein